MQTMRDGIYVQRTMEDLMKDINKAQAQERSLDPNGERPQVASDTDPCGLQGEWSTTEPWFRKTGTTVSVQLQDGAPPVNWPRQELRSLTAKFRFNQDGSYTFNASEKGVEWTRHKGSYLIWRLDAPGEVCGLVLGAALTSVWVNPSVPFALEGVDAKVLYTYAQNIYQVEKLNGSRSLSPLDNKTFRKVSISDIISGRSQRWPFMLLVPPGR
jgi:hypothetical protein